MEMKRVIEDIAKRPKYGQFFKNNGMTSLA